MDKIPTLALDIIKVVDYDLWKEIIAGPEEAKDILDEVQSLLYDFIEKEGLVINNG